MVIDTLVQRREEWEAHSSYWSIAILKCSQIHVANYPLLQEKVMFPDWGPIFPPNSGFSSPLCFLILGSILWALGSAFWEVFPFTKEMACTCSWLAFSVCFVPIGIWDTKATLHFEFSQSLSFLIFFFFFSISFSQSWWALLKTVFAWSLTVVYSSLQSYTHYFFLRQSSILGCMWNCHEKTLT